MAEEAKAKGNASFSSGDFTSAILHFTEAIDLSPTDHVLYSNRSAAHASLHQYANALSDAYETIKLKPHWPKGYSRFGAALLGLNQFDLAVTAYKNGLDINPTNEELKSGLADAEASVYKKERAKKENELGNAAYTKKEFAVAIEHYCKAIEIDDVDISYITNRAAVYLELGEYNECIKDCDEAVERGRDLSTDYKMVAKALTRKGTALTKMVNCSKDYEPAIEAFQKALTEHRNSDTLERLKEAERAKKDWELKEYFDPKIGDEEREKGNDFFKEQKYPDAIKHYTEAIKRNPKDPEAYSNRAACYTKLGAMPDGQNDAEKCIEIDPTFSKGYSRKATVQFFLKEYNDAMKTYQEGLKHDPHNQELLDGISRCVQEINKASRGDLTPVELKERQAKGMQDPEIQNILTDPVMRQVLTDLQENLIAAQRHMQNPMVMNKIQKLISAGIVQMK
ncbi:PREDICTED: hsp70-Hsp90 organizing protein 2-like [Camelina sativa]|uniref:Hsp70-Hsp90 organizing protein 2-like n=1 Tax=Camelina sativa TaxID=90675 RepID=A0ABM0VN17_CAMSA|nr:PREDICTED: hsp70-Hsp90 organizing protein 2-like [Camelina sativa]